MDAEPEATLAAGVRRHAENTMIRRWGTEAIFVAFLAGLLLYGFTCYRVAMAGGLSATA